ncbi:MAG: hypothetical protein M3R15_29140, partial [Acidobacteriota bacterium]|nr:hypothetical protein [Acidobacteriota bacterium]
IEFTNNIVRNVAAGIHIAGRDSLFSEPNSTRGRRIRLANNLFDIEGWPYDGDGCFAKLGDGANQVTFEHNTILQVGSLAKVWGAQGTGLVFRNNLSRHNEYGFFGDGAGTGTPALNTYFPGAIFTRNLMTKESGAPWNVETIYPAGNFFPDTLDAVGFVNRGAGDYRLAASSAYRGAGTDGRDVGCDFAALDAAQAGGGTTPTPTPEEGWTFCANENQRCSFTGTKQARYGAAGSYYYGTFTNGVDCTNAVFGDPLRGVVKRCEYSAAITPTPTPTPAPTQAAATYLRTDTTTQGNWQGAYGTQGYQVIGNAASMPSYAQVTPTGHSSWTWAASTTETRALRKAAGTDRIAATWYADSSFNVELNLMDGQTHRVALYLLDWDSRGRAQSIEVSDAATGAVLDTRSNSGFTNGRYVVWNIRGRVRLRVTRTAGPNAVMSGLFLDAP